SERVMREEHPDRLLILGDTNSALSAVVAKRLGIPVYHMEAGNRCYDDRVPEEVNRRIVDHSSDVLMPYTERSRQNLLRQGFEAEGDVQFHAPFGLFDFVALERRAFCVISDSGTVQEECCIFRVANVTIRDVTERPETIECGSNMVSGADPRDIARCVRTVLDRRGEWTVPPEY